MTRAATKQQTHLLFPPSLEPLITLAVGFLWALLCHVLSVSDGKSFPQNCFRPTSYVSRTWTVFKNVNSRFKCHFLSVVFLIVHPYYGGFFSYKLAHSQTFVTPTSGALWSFADTHRDGEKLELPNVHFPDSDGVRRCCLLGSQTAALLFAVSLVPRFSYFCACRWLQCVKRPPSCSADVLSSYPKSGMFLTERIQLVSFAQAWRIVLLAVSAKWGSQQLFNKVSLNRNTHDTRWCTDGLRKTLWPEIHRNPAFPLGASSVFTWLDRTELPWIMRTECVNEFFEGRHLTKGHQVVQMRLSLWLVSLVSLWPLHPWVE